MEPYPEFAISMRYTRFWALTGDFKAAPLPQYLLALLPKLFSCTYEATDHSFHT